MTQAERAAGCPDNAVAVPSTEHGSAMGATNEAAETISVERAVPFLQLPPSLLPSMTGSAAGPGRVTGQYLNGVCVGKIDGFSWCRQKPTSSCPFSSERPVFDSSRRETASPGGGSSNLYRFLIFLLFFKSKKTIPPLVQEQEADTPLSLSPLFPVIDLSIPFCY